MSIRVKGPTGLGLWFVAALVPWMHACGAAVGGSTEKTSEPQVEVATEEGSQVTDESNEGSVEQSGEESAVNGAAERANDEEDPPAEPGAEGDQASQPHVVLLPAGRDPVSVKVEVVWRPADRQMGLMHREYLGPDDGMLFLFEEPKQQAFWMKNTLLPLDILFIRSDLSVLGVVENAEPLTLTPRSVPGESQYVLEVNAGYARAHGVGAGTMVQFDGVPAVFGATDSAAE